MNMVPSRTKLITFLSRSFSSSTAQRLPRFRCTNKIPNSHRCFVVEEAQKVLREYLHGTKSLPFVFSDLIAKNSPLSLSVLVRNVRFSVLDFSRSLAKALRYEPINEFQFFLESIGIDYHRVHRYLPRNKFFFSEDLAIIESTFALTQFGFPWNTLGKLYENEDSIFRKPRSHLNVLLYVFKEYFGFENLPVVGICLAFPHLLTLENEARFCGDTKAIFDDLKRVFVEFNVESCVQGNVDDWYELCCKVRVFYDLGCTKGKVSEFMCATKDAFHRCPIEVLVQKVDYFTMFGVNKVDVGMLLLQNPEILELDLETPVISVLRVLEHFGLDKKRLQCVCQKYSHVLGRNEIANLPRVMKASDLNEWFFDRVKSSGPRLLATCAISYPEEDLDVKYSTVLNRIKSSRCPGPSLGKVDFLKKVGFGENEAALKVLRHVRGSRDQLLKRFDCFLNIGIKYSMVCLLIRKAPQILMQNSEGVRQKVKFLRDEMGLPLEDLYSFPAFVCYDLDRINYRYRFFVWLMEKGLRKKGYCISTVISTSEKSFIARLSRIHPAVPKQYLECFSGIRFIDTELPSLG